MNEMPKVTTTTSEMTALLKAIQVQKDESKLFQFLNGLDEVFGPQRSQLLMLSPLPSVEMACAAIQQEESQRDVLQNLKNSDEDISAMFSKGNLNTPEKSVVCTACKKKSHMADACWTVTGYPKWHYRSLRTSARGGGSSGRWNGQRNAGARSTNVVQTAGGKGEASNVVIIHQQFEQLLKLIPGNAMAHGQTEEEFDTPFSGMITCGAAESKIQEWIVDSGASDHMTCSLNLLHNVRPAPPRMTIKLPTGSTANITHIGDTV